MKIRKLNNQLAKYRMIYHNFQVNNNKHFNHNNQMNLQIVKKSNLERINKINIKKNTLYKNQVMMYNLINYNNRYN